MILDSSFLIDIEGEIEDALAKARDIEAKGLPRRVPLIVVSELYISVGKGTRTAENRRRVDRVLESLHLVVPTVSIAKRAGVIEGECQAEDESEIGIGLADALIAAIALEYDEPIVTGDPDDVRRVEGVRVETYWPDPWALAGGKGNPFEGLIASPGTIRRVVDPEAKSIDPTRGSEQCGTRPCLVVQNDVGNENAPTTIVVPFTTSFGDRPYPFEVLVPADVCALREDSVAIWGQLRTISIDHRVTENLGGIPPYRMDEVDTALEHSLGLTEI